MAEITTYKIYYSSRTNADGSMWCPDCRQVEASLEHLFNQPIGPRAEIIYVGDRQTWKDPKCIYRQEPLKLTSIPTVLKFANGQVVGRVEEEDILNDPDKMNAFIRDPLFQ